MTDRRREELLNDAALDREIERALAVEPSPEFVARVRTRLAADAAPRFDVRLLRWMVMGGASMAAAGLAAALYFGLSSPEHSASGSAVENTRGRDTALPGGQDQAPLKPETPDVARAAQPQPRVLSVAAARTPAAKANAERETFPEVMVSASEVEGMRQLMSLWRRGVRIVEASDAGSVSDPEHMPDIVIEPITIEPIALVKMEGVAE